MTTSPGVKVPEERVFVTLSWGAPPVGTSIDEQASAEPAVFAQAALWRVVTPAGSGLSTRTAKFRLAAPPAPASEGRVRLQAPEGWQLQPDEL